MFSIADTAAAKFGFETVMVVCGKIVNQDASLSQVHTTPDAAELMSIVDDAFNDLPEDDEEATSQDADWIPSTEVKGHNGSLWWLKKAIATQVTKLGGKFASDKNFPWKMMLSTLASGSLNIEGYPAHKCLMSGESHDPTSKNNKGIGVLTFKEVAALVDAFKAGTMQVVKSSNTPNYGDPEHVGTSVAQTRVKKGKNRACDPEDGEAVMSPPPARPFKVAAKPTSFKPLTPPPTHPFWVVAKPTAPMAPKAAVQEVIEITSTSEGSRDVTVEVDAEYEDVSCEKKWKLNSGSSSWVSKKCVSAEVVIEPKKEGMHSKAKPSTSNVSVLKGGPLSPLTVGSSFVDEERSSGNEAAQHVQPATCIWNGPPNIQPKSKVIPKPKHITKASWAAMCRVHQMMYTGNSEEEDGPGHKDSATTDAGKGDVMLADPQPEPTAQLANPTPIELPATMVAPFSPPEVMPSMALQHEGSEQLQPSNGMLQTMSSPSTPGNDENGNPQAQSMDYPSSHPTGERPLLQPEPLHTPIEAVNHYAHSPHAPLPQHDAPITLHPQEGPSYPHDAGHYCEAHDSLYNRNSTIHTHPHPTSSLNPHGLSCTHNLKEAQYAHVPMGYNHYLSHYNSPGEGYNDRYDDHRHPSDLYYQDMRGHDGRYYGDTNRWADCC
ncbi:hypothetical protein BDR04DRAFT_1112775 [Suillus decipiens]|nr:hypothetical protein BDR04DRAFT_1112775 [Suillus decipiens]